MKLLRPNLRAPRSDDTLGRGMDIALTLALFVVGGLALDRWLGTSPIFMIALMLLAAVGLFARSKYQYDAAHGRARGRAARAGRRRQEPVAAMTEPSMLTTRIEGPAPEVEVSLDLIKRGLIVAPVLVAVCAVIWGGDGAWSSMYGIALVLANFAARRRADRDDDPDLAHDDARRRCCSATSSASA